MAAAKRPSPELTNKVNVNPVGNRLQEATAEDYIETAEILNDHAEKIDALTGSATPSPNYGTYTSLALLQAAYPVGEANAYAIIDAGIGATPQLALWDSTDLIWTINSVAENVKFVTNDAARPAPGLENMIYVTLDNFKAYVWKNSQYNLIFSLKSTSDLINDVPFLLASDALSPVSSTNKLITEADLNSNSQPNELIEKGFNHIINFDWHVFAQKYRWNGVLYEAPEDLVIDTVTIDPAPTTVNFKRFDVIVFNDDFTFSKVVGDEGLNPAIPKIDIRTQIQLTVILVEYGTTEPSYLTKQLMYDEGVGLPAEFAVTKTGANITINDTTQFSSGTKSIKVVNPVASNVLFLDKNATFNSLDIDTISFKIKNGQKSNPSFYLYSYNSIGAFYQGTTEIKNGKYGYDSQNITDWQIIIAPRSKILGGSEIYNTGWALTFKPTTGTYYFDEFAMNGNFTQAPISSGVTEAPIDNGYYVRRNASWYSVTALFIIWDNAAAWLNAHIANKQNSLAPDSTGEKYPTVDAVNAGLATKLDASAYNQHFKGVYLTLAALNIAHPTASVGDYAQVNETGATDVLNYNWDVEESVWVPNAVTGSGATNTDALPEGSTNLYFTVARWLANLTKANIEAKLTGEITSHTHPASGGTSSSNINAGTFTGVIDVSQGNNVYYDDYDSGAVVNLSLSATKLFGSIATFRVKGDLTGAIPTAWNYSGQPITANTSKYNELTLLYKTTNDIRIVNRVVNFIDTVAPSVPTGLASSNITDTSVTLTWNASTDNVSVASYKVRQGGVVVSSPITNSATITGLTAETLYSFTVSALDVNGNESGESVALNVTTIATPVVAFETEYQAWLDYGTANGYDLPSGTQQGIDNNKVKYLKQIGAFNELDTIKIFNATYTPTSWATNIYRLDFKNPSNYILTAVAGKEPTWISGSGFKSVGSSGNYIKTGVIPSSSLKYTLTNCSIISKPFSLPITFSADSFWSGTRNSNTGQQILLGNSLNNEVLMRCQSINTNFTIAQNNVNQHYHVYINGANKKVFVNGNTELVGVVGFLGTPSMPTIELYLLGFNNNGVVFTSSVDCGISYFLLGGALDTLKDSIYQILNETYIP